MGTRSITRVVDEYNQPIIEMYKQFDGYPSGLGMDLLEFVLSKTLVNGLRLNEGISAANGMEDFAAQLITYFKESHLNAGHVYLYPPDAISEEDAMKDRGWFIHPGIYANKYGVEYVYYIYPKNNKLQLVCYDTHDCKEIDLMEIAKAEMAKRDKMIDNAEEDKLMQDNSTESRFDKEKEIPKDILEHQDKYITKED